MTIYNQEKTEIIENPDLEKGYLATDYIPTKVPAEYKHHEAVEGREEEGHYEILARFPNGGVSRQWVVDVPAIEAHEAWDELIQAEGETDEQIQVYIPYTDEELLEIKLRPYKDEIYELKKYLSDTDYCVIKSIEQGTTIQVAYPEEYQKRIEARDKINELEEVIQGK